MMALPNRSDDHSGSNLPIEKISSIPFDLSTALQILPTKRILQLEPPVTPLMKQTWASITTALYQGKCDLIADVYHMWLGMVQRLSANDPREELEDNLAIADIRFLIHPEEPTPRWVFDFGYPVKM